MTLEEFNAALMEFKPALVDQLKRDISDHAHRVADAAASKLGHYQPGWQRLAPSTLARKSADTPLYESGDLKRDIHADEEDASSISVVTEEVIPTTSMHSDGTASGEVLLSMGIGSRLPYAEYQELGTRTIPPRPFLLPALIEGDVDLEQKLDESVDVILAQILGA